MRISGKAASVLTVSVLLCGAAMATDFNKDREAILAMAGTFEVDFHFEETVSFLPDYEVKEPYDEDALETVIVIEDSGDKIVLQHLLSTGRGGIIKHWRQDWEYENTVLWEYQGKNKWTKKTLSPEEAKGTWTQRVYQVDDSPRYEARGEWEHIGDLSQWTSARTNRPLPRRDYTKRDDYDFLEVVNRQAITPDGWVHEQDNTKIAIVEEYLKPLCREFGLNQYKKVEDEKGDEARAWWEEHKPFWKEVRETWAAVFQSRDEIVIAKEIEGDSLMDAIRDLGRDDEANTQTAEARPKIEKAITGFIQGG
ncbi:MAG: hypothetical protein H6752_18110 [Candidatus Omnitrophica bacterium]|nr:hypothetical protein [Candidatus Omnitrophota bacterium]